MPLTCMQPDTQLGKQVVTLSLPIEGGRHPTPSAHLLLTAQPDGSDLHICTVRAEMLNMHIIHNVTASTRSQQRV